MRRTRHRARVRRARASCSSLPTAAALRFAPRAAGTRLVASHLRGRLRGFGVRPPLVPADVGGPAPAKGARGLGGLRVAEAKLRQLLAPLRDGARERVGVAVHVEANAAELAAHVEPGGVLAVYPLHVGQRVPRAHDDRPRRIRSAASSRSKLPSSSVQSRSYRLTLPPPRHMSWAAKTSRRSPHDHE